MALEALTKYAIANDLDDAAFASRRLEALPIQSDALSGRARTIGAVESPKAVARFLRRLSLLHESDFCSSCT